MAAFIGGMLLRISAGAGRAVLERPPAHCRWAHLLRVPEIEFGGG